jgi:hypothetical protein
LCLTPQIAGLRPIDWVPGGNRRYFDINPLTVSGLAFVNSMVAGYREVAEVARIVCSSQRIPAIP